ncbi:MAG: universal stress protein [Cyclobacteriaceae bacterium]|nr:MAG: universal stress protein [Cyclobacteriaceae bacterium]
MKNILVPCDFSDHSRAAAATGAWLARKTGANLHLLHVVYTLPEWNKMPVEQQQNYPKEEARMVEAEIKLDKLAGSAMFKSCNIQTHVHNGYPRELIVQFAHTYNMQLIIMGTHGTGESQNLFVGSTAQQVIRSARCPVLSVKKDYKPDNVKRIAFASDFDPASDAVDQLKNIAVKIGADVDLVLVNTPMDFYDTPTAEKRLKAAVPAQQQVKFRTHIFNDLTREQGIINFSRYIQADWIAMMVHPRARKPYYYLGSAETVLYHSEVPVLSFRFQEKG